MGDDATCERVTAHTGEHGDIVTGRCARAEAAEAEVEGLGNLVNRQGDLLTGVVNALRGDPPPLTTWSHHDAPDLAKAAAAKLTAIRALADEWYSTGHGPEGAALYDILDGPQDGGDGR